jgi:hypothetical protein
MPEGDTEMLHVVVINNTVEFEGEFETAMAYAQEHKEERPLLTTKRNYEARQNRKTGERKPAVNVRYKLPAFSGETVARAVAWLRKHADHEMVKSDKVWQTVSGNPNTPVTKKQYHHLGHLAVKVHKALA